MKKPRQRIAEAASRPGDAESRPWMACGGESGMDACRAGERPPVGTPLLPKPAHRPLTLGSPPSRRSGGEQKKPPEPHCPVRPGWQTRSEEHTSETPSLMRNTYAALRV